MRDRAYQLLNGGSDMVGIECKACGERVLLRHETGKMDHEIIAMMSPTATCSRCNESRYLLVSLKSDLADAWLMEGASSSNAGPLIEGDKQA
jgi:hypothetical protein